MLIRSSILRMMERRLELRLCSILSPVKKVRTKSARESASIFGCSTSIFLAMRFIWMLFVTGTTLSVPALMGAIICMGVATANSVLIVTFANELLERYKDPYRAALEAGYVRIRPVLMTALAMITGMVPMALSLGEGGEQNAPLGRAVIGGLIFATVATLFFVPTVFMLVSKRRRCATEDVSPEPAFG